MLEQAELAQEGSVWLDDRPAEADVANGRSEGLLQAAVYVFRNKSGVSS